MLVPIVIALPLKYVKLMPSHRLQDSKRLINKIDDLQSTIDIFTRFSYSRYKEISSDYRGDQSLSPALPSLLLLQDYSHNRYGTFNFSHAYPNSTEGMVSCSLKDMFLLVAFL